MDTLQTEILREIEGFLADTEMPKTVFGLRVANDGKLVDRLRDGNVTLKTAQRIRDFIAQHRAEAAE
jgi:hypothetical protein